MYRCWVSTVHKVTSLSAISPSQRAAFASDLCWYPVSIKKEENLPVPQTCRSPHNHQITPQLHYGWKKLILGSFTRRTFLKVEGFILATFNLRIFLLFSNVFLFNEITPTWFLITALVRFAEMIGRNAEMAIPNLNILINLALGVGHTHIEVKHDFFSVLVRNSEVWMYI